MEVAIDLRCSTQANSFEIKDGTRRLDQLACFSRAGGLPSVSSQIYAMGRDWYFICSMVVSRVVDCYQWIFSEDKAPADFVDPEIFAPFFAFCEHDIRLLNIVLPCT